MSKKAGELTLSPFDFKLILKFNENPLYIYYLIDREYRLFFVLFSTILNQ